MQAVERVDAGNQNLAEHRVEHAIWASCGPGGQVIVENQGATHGVCTCPEDHLLRDFSRIPKEFVGPTTIAFRIVVEGMVRRLCTDIRDDLYLIGQEGLVNAFRHSRATEVEAQIVYTVDRFQMYIRDNGCGIDLRTLTTARIRQWGLSSMRERADRIGAKLKILSRASRGTEIELLVPGLIAFESHVPNCFRGWFSMAYLSKQKGTESESLYERSGANSYPLR